MGKQDRYPDHSDVEEVMDNVGGWARSWDDVLWYVDGPAVYDADIAEHEVPQLRNAFQDAERKHLPYTTDYRELWQELTGEDTSGLPPQKGIVSYGFSPRQLADDLQETLEFPAEKGAIMLAAERKHEPRSALEALQKIENKRYDNVWMLIEEVGDQTWDHD